VTTRTHADIFAEPAEVDPDTLRNLGPLRRMAGIWEGVRGEDVHPVREGARRQAFVERFELQPIDPQTNGPQLLYGLHYAIRAVRPGEMRTYHHQVGYFLWESATETVIQTLAIPRGQIAMAVGRAKADATRFELRAERGLLTYGICSNPFLDEAFRTDSYRITVTLHLDLRRGHRADGPWLEGALPPHRLQHPGQGRGADAQSPRRLRPSRAQLSL
jgi:hypothetical protein